MESVKLFGPHREIPKFVRFGEERSLQMAETGYMATFPATMTFLSGQVKR